MTTFDSTSVSLVEMLRDVITGKVQLPDFQRGWIWNNDQICDLLVSVATSYPIGTVMLLESGGSARFRSRPVEGLERAISKDHEPEKLILDGQQRLTSLVHIIAMKGPVHTRTASRQAIKRHYYFDIRKVAEQEGRVEGAIVVVDEHRKRVGVPGKQTKLDLSTVELECRAMCFPCSQIMLPEVWQADLFRINPGAKAQYEVFKDKVLDSFHRCQLPVILLKQDTPKRDVCRAFERANLNGAQLSVFELLTAKYAAADYSLRDDWYGSLPREILSRKSNIERNPLLEGIDACQFIQAINLLHTHDLRMAGMSNGKSGKQLRMVSANRNDILDLPLEAWKTWAARLESAYEQVAYFLRAEALYHQRELPYSNQLIPLAAVMARIGDRWREPQIREKLARWYWCGVLGELYDGAVETRIANDYEELLVWFDKDVKTPGTVREASFDSGRFDFLHTRNSAAYKAVALLVLRDGAEDWFWRTSIRDLKIYEISIDIHHIFPRSWCERQGIPQSRYDSILNKSLLSYKANRKIGRSAPSEYIEKLVADKQVGLSSEALDAVLSSHALSAEILRTDDFHSFTEDRRERLSALVANAMGKTI